MTCLSILYYESTVVLRYFEDVSCFEWGTRLIISHAIDYPFVENPIHRSDTLLKETVMNM